MKKKKNDKGYRFAIFGAKGVLRILIYVCVGVAIFGAGKTAYSFGYALFNQKTMESGEGRDVTVIIPEDSSNGAVAKILEKNGLIESKNIFKVQAKLSKYKEGFKAGTFILNTSQTADEMMAILAGENVEGQPSKEAEKKATEDSSVYDKVDADGEESSTNGDADTQKSGSESAAEE